ncbi:SEC-C metal-binding domain-containing protein [Priestia aryabhattai]|uniref:SEC-C metal-binding domain-containing protein n=1 Tax=Priestia aryabhattai TaxID=412384 RepID=UPI0027E08C25|nr:SEC-C metal-binding domain-containing protein [Priestia aryabhattai]
MSQVPAFCTECGLIFPSRQLSISNSRNITIENCTEECISCGSIAKVPDGVYNFIGETIELLSGPERTVEELNRLAEILRVSKRNNSSYEQVMDEVQREVPQVASLLSMILPKTPDQFYAFMNLLLATIMFLTNLSSGENEKIEPKQSIEVNHVVNYIYEENKIIYDEQKKRVSKPIIVENKIGRNDPCYCDSGKKYKKCHGLNGN